LYRDMEISGGVKKIFVGNCYAAFVRSDEAGDAIQERGFTGARRAEKDADARRNGEIDVEMKRAAGEADANAEFGLR